MRGRKRLGSASTPCEVPSNFSPAVAPVVYTIHRLGRKNMHTQTNNKKNRKETQKKYLSLRVSGITILPRCPSVLINAANDAKYN